MYNVLDKTHAGYIIPYLDKRVKRDPHNKYHYDNQNQWTHNHFNQSFFIIDITCSKYMLFSKRHQRSNDVS